MNTLAISGAHAGAIDVIEATSPKQRKDFVKFPLALYRDCPQYVPPLILDEMETLSPDKNPAFQVAPARLFLAYQSGRIVGRIAGILSHPANEKNNSRNMRFGWFDCVNDQKVAAALFDAVAAWARQAGMETLTGPHGFDLFDKAGMLVDGFDQLPTVATYYNYPYYNDLVVACGFEKEIDFVEYQMKFKPDGFSPRQLALAERVLKHKKYHLVEFKRKKELLALAPQIMELFEDTYAELYDCVPLTVAQRQYYIKKFFPYLKRELVKVVVSEHGEVVGFLIAMPSLSHALQKARGHLLPFGLFHLLRALKAHNPILDFCLAGVRKSHRGKGVDLIMTADIFRSALELKFELGESNPELETNLQIQAEWNKVEHVMHKRRRIYRKSI